MIIKPQHRIYPFVTDPAIDELDEYQALLTVENNEVALAQLDGRRLNEINLDLLIEALLKAKELLHHD